MNYSFTATCNEKTSLSGDLAKGKKMKGEYGIEVPEDWKEIEIHFTSGLLSDTLVFKIYRDQ